MSEVTKQDLLDLGNRIMEALSDQENRIMQRMHDQENRLTELMRDQESRHMEAMSNQEHRAVESMRDMQTELLRGFEAFSVPQGIRLRKLEVDQSNLDHSLSSRMDVLEKRLHQIEVRLFGGQT